MIIYSCRLTLHDNVFFATREMGILYETEKYLHNWALSYALFEVKYINKPYRLQGTAAQKPGYFDSTCEQNLLVLNQAGIYVFPAQPVSWSYQVNTFKAAQVAYYGVSKQFGDKGANRNYPINYGRAKELAVGSQYRTYIVAREAIEIPRWIRLGKWAAKIRVETTPIPSQAIQRKTGEYTCTHPLNPIDLPSSTRLLLYNRIVMPPVSLAVGAQLTGEYWKVSPAPEFPELSEICLPTGVCYGASLATAA